ncbi:MAG: GNAT family N-acetyltransferase [Candidatus Dormiibacterota bacterium]
MDTDSRLSGRGRDAPRPVRAEDGARIGDIYLLAVRKAMPWLQLAHADDAVRAWFAGEMLDSHEVWVVEMNGVVHAFLALSPDHTSVNHLYVDPQAQGVGLGTELLQLAKVRSPGRLRLWAFQRNHRARTFYERRGFEAIEFGDGTANQEGEPDVLYRWGAPSSEGTR